MTIQELVEYILRNRGNINPTTLKTAIRNAAEEYGPTPPGPGPGPGPEPPTPGGLHKITIGETLNTIEIDTSISKADVAAILANYPEDTILAYVSVQGEEFPAMSVGHNGSTVYLECLDTIWSSDEENGWTSFASYFPYNIGMDFTISQMDANSNLWNGVLIGAYVAAEVIPHFDTDRLGNFDFSEIGGSVTKFTLNLNENGKICDKDGVEISAYDDFDLVAKVGRMDDTYTCSMNYISPDITTDNPFIIPGREMWLEDQWVIIPGVSNIIMTGDPDSGGTIELVDDPTKCCIYCFNPLATVYGATCRKTSPLRLYSSLSTSSNVFTGIGSNNKIYSLDYYYSHDQLYPTVIDFTDGSYLNISDTEPVLNHEFANVYNTVYVHAYTDNAKFQEMLDNKIIRFNNSGWCEIDGVSTEYGSYSENRQLIYAFSLYKWYTTEYDDVEQTTVYTEYTGEVIVSLEGYILQNHEYDSAYTVYHQLIQFYDISTDTTSTVLDTRDLINHPEGIRYNSVQFTPKNTEHNSGTWSNLFYKHNGNFTVTDNSGNTYYAGWQVPNGITLNVAVSNIEVDQYILGVHSSSSYGDAHIYYDNTSRLNSFNFTTTSGNLYNYFALEFAPNYKRFQNEYGIELVSGPEQVAVDGTVTINVHSSSDNLDRHYSIANVAGQTIDHIRYEHLYGIDNNLEITLTYVPYTLRQAMDSWQSRNDYYYIPVDTNYTLNISGENGTYSGTRSFTKYYGEDDRGTFSGTIIPTESYILPENVYYSNGNVESYNSETGEIVLYPYNYDSTLQFVCESNATSLNNIQLINNGSGAYTTEVSLPVSDVDGLIIPNDVLNCIDTISKELYATVDCGDPYIYNNLRFSPIEWQNGQTVWNCANVSKEQMDFQLALIPNNGVLILYMYDLGYSLQSGTSVYVSIQVQQHSGS